MPKAQQLETCPECHYQGYVFDPACRVWCCPRCQRMETVAQRRARAGAADVSAPHTLRVIPPAPRRAAARASARG